MIMFAAMLVVILFVFAIAYYLATKMSKIKILRLNQLPLFGKMMLSIVVFLLAFITKSVMLAFLIYLILFLFIGDLISFFIRCFGTKLHTIWNKVYAKGILAVSLALIVTGYGWYNVKQIQVKEYDIKLTKEFNGIEKLRIAAISDLHLGTTMKEEGLADLVEQINSLNPDIIFLVGDIYDESTSENLKTASFEEFEKLTSTYGTYYVIGNHELYETNGYTKDIEGLKSAGVTVLLDESVLVADSFYVVGRQDVSLTRMGQMRKSLDSILAGLDSSYPILLLNHQPDEMEEADSLGVDLQLSGHTHAGQIFPGNLIVSLFNDMGYGKKQFNHMTAIVSSGVGAWGFPVRVGSNSEIIVVNTYGK